MSESADPIKKEDTEQPTVVSEKALNGNKEEPADKENATAEKADEPPKQEEEKPALNNGEAEADASSAAEKETETPSTEAVAAEPAAEEKEETEAAPKQEAAEKVKPAEETNEVKPATESTDAESKPAEGAAEEEKKEESKENGDDEEGESSDEELPPGLLERPIEILREKRPRKKVNRFMPDEISTPSPSKKVIEIKEGSGVKVASHPRVCWQLQKNKVADLKLVHKLFYGVWGDDKTCKKNILQFSGFTFEKDSKEYEKKEDYIAGFTMPNLKWMLDCVDVKVSGNKDDQLDALMAWCMCPKPSGKEIPNKKKYNKKKKTESSGAEGEEGNTTTEDGESSGTKKKSPTKKPTKRKASIDKKTTVKITSPSSAKKAKKTPNSTPNKPPSNAQIVKCVKKILDGANLEEITMKTVCIKVYAQYPKFDLSDRKSFIKETVRKVIS